MCLKFIVASRIMMMHWCELLLLLYITLHFIMMLFLLHCDVWPDFQGEAHKFRMIYDVYNRIYAYACWSVYCV